MKHLTFPSRADAEARSHSEWLRVLGRPKRPRDVTENLWPLDIAELEAGKTVLAIPESDESRLTLAERSRLSARKVT